MFRQIKMFPKDQDYQRILWRDNPSNEINEYRLTTVTYGLASSPYLSTKVLQRLAVDEKSNYPLASKVTLNDFYVDDLLTGASSTAEAHELVSQLQKMMKKGGFELRKWSSNDPDVLRSIPDELLQSKPSLDLEKENLTKVLGLTWNPSQDVFSINVSVQPSLQKITKRTVLSDIAKIFDPLGWLSPFVIFAKIILQKLWSFNLNWDDEIPLKLKKNWQEARAQLSSLKTIKIPRLVLTPNSVKIEIHGFCDASQKAYAAVIYLRSVSCDSTAFVKMLAAKTRVAPLKTITLPRLELCAALLLSNLLKAVKDSLCLEISKIYAWTDSTVVLSWLSAEPSRWQTFVSNRVSEIQQIIPSECWCHIKGKENPADCASRGLLPSELPLHNLWWNGPSWLHNSSFEVPELCTPINENALKEERKNYSCIVSQVNHEMPILSQVSSIVKLKRVIAWCLRFIYNARAEISKRKSGFLTRNEVDNAEICVVKQVQNSVFHPEIRCISSEKCLPNSSKLTNLSPFLDKNGVLRVGGRLRHANLPENQIHPIVLPKNHPITDLVLRHYHLSLLHAGPQLLLSVIRQKFWILSGRDVVRRFVKKCVICARISACASKQMMADLPSSRVVPSRPFSKTGVDYAGPFLYKTRNGRGAKTLKCYVSIFVCFSSKAIHIELVSDLSSEAFIASLKRFVARRGKPSEIISDCGTNFVGASKELKKVYQFLASSQNNEQINKYLSSEEILWHFNPPSAPHFGGLWEAGVKSIKFHLKRIMGNAVLTFEEFSTLLTQIEACLNSRPLCPLSSDPNDLTALTPGHFLIGAPLAAIPEKDVTDVPQSRLKRWQLVQRVFQYFWKRWCREYLSNLQQRSKWCKEEFNIQEGDLVLLKNENVAPLRWKLARVVKTHPGQDKKVRVVTLKTDSSELKRPITKLCKLPLSA